MSLLKRGPSGAHVDEIEQDMGLEQLSLPLVKKVIDKMVKDKLLKRIGVNRFAVVSAVRSAGKETHEIVIERVNRGSAVVRVDNVLRCLMTPGEYDGPRQLIRKNMRFRAVADLQRIDGELYVRVKDITEILE